MAALSGTCVRQWLRFLGSNAARTRTVDHSTHRRTLPSSNNHARLLVRPLSVTTLLRNEEKQSNQPTESAMPLVAMLREAEEKAKRETEDDRKKKEERKKRTARIQKWAMRITGGMLVGASLLTVYELGQPQLDDHGKVIVDEFENDFIVLAYLKRAYKEMNTYRTMIAEPSAEKLLPDPLVEPYYQPPYTLVLEMKDVLVHPEWTYANGWRFKKRPGVEYFLQQAGPPLFEIVIYTSEQGFTAFPILDSLDPKGCIMYRLFRDATKYVNGHHVKDLSSLNRDLSKVIIVDCNAKSYQLQPKNALGLKKWEGNDDDRTLFELAAFLRTIAASNVEDVRTVLEFYQQFDDPMEAFRINQARLQREQEEEAKRLAEAKEKGGSSLVGGWTKGLIGRR
ncbi:mitochondrial import inner membrane translocase subunit TIM50-like [Lytechinus variegatus]|uniref:mitochondrial import inner membrane translocase subunit TIM50-like n=1 Tax=Lytechinus variegatus TaxID=7654 RepID=UPI001BB2C068|nr:mitochondrial import inner membrane translocase subunit TIM50-like [Lytechinus variegatus]